MFQEPLQHAAVGDWVKSGDWRYLIFDNLAVLDMPAEYVCNDLGNGKAKFSFIPPKDVGSESLIMSKLETILELYGTKSVTLKGLKFQHTAFYGTDDFNTIQSAITSQNSDGITIKNNQISNTAMNGVLIRNTKNVNIEQNVFLDIGYLGVKSAGPKLTENLAISNNYLDGCGMTRFWQPVCLGIVGYNNIYVHNNEITNTANGGIQLISAARGSTYWSDQGITEPTRNDYIYRIEFNHVHDFGHGILSDYGAIKTGAKYKCDEMMQPMKTSKTIAMPILTCTTTCFMMVCPISVVQR